MTIHAILEIPSQRRGLSPVLIVALIALHVSVLLWFSEPVTSFRSTTIQNQNQHHLVGISSLSISSSLSMSSEKSLQESQSQSQSQTQHQHQNQHVVVVGGGIGGMAVAARIASSQQSSDSTTRVTLLEKNAEIGGRCGSFWVNADQEEDNLFRHEQGPSLLLLKSVYEDVFRETTGREAIDYGLQMVQCSPAYQVVFDDGDRISVGFPKTEKHSSNSALLLEEQESRSRAQMETYEPDGAAKWDDYLATTEAYLDAGLPNFIEEKLDLWSLPNFLYRSLKDGAKAWPLRAHSEVLDDLFESDKLRALASFQDLYVGLEPYKNNDLLGGGVLKSTAPAVFGLLAAIELHPSNKNAGVFAPIGGFQSVTNAFQKLLEELGVEIRCDTTVSKVTNEGVWVSENDSTSSSSESEFIPSDLVIVNADLPYAKKTLLSKERSDAKSPIPPSTTDKFDWDDSFSFSSGVISFYWSLDKPLDALNTHNVFLSTKTRSEAEASWNVLRETPTLFREDDEEESAPFNFYVHRPSHTDPSAAPSGRDAIMVLVPCRTLLRDEECAKLPRDQAMKKYQEQFSPAEISKVKRAVLKRFAALESLQDLEDHILHEEVRTPATWADRYNLAAGTPFALVSYHQLLFFL